VWVPEEQELMLPNEHTHTVSCTCSYNHTIHDANGAHDYLIQHVHVSSPLNEGLHCIHLTSDCSPHEGCEPITLRTKTTVMMTVAKHALTLAVDGEQSMLAVAECPILPVTCGNTSGTLCLCSHETCTYSHWLC